MEQAAWCLLTKQSPDTYMKLSALEREAFLDLATMPRR
jgi:hypothetical protein